MDTQEQQLGNVGAFPVDSVHSKKLIPLLAGAAVLAMVAVFGVYFFAFRSLPTTVSWAPSVSAITPGGEVTVAGRITPAESGRQVLIEGAPSAGGPWQRMVQAATTDSLGRFAISFKPAIKASMIMRVVVDPAGRYLEVTGKSMPVRLLSLSSINLTVGGLVTNQIPVNFTVTVDPPTIGRTVRLEQSSDNEHWTAVGPPARTQAGGKTVVRVPGLAVGVWSYRATVAQDDKFAAALSPMAHATVEDIKVVAARAAAAHAKAVAELARQAKASVDRQAAAAEAVKKAASTRPAPQYGYQCMPGDENLYAVCAGHKAWIDGQIVYDACLAAGKTWDIATQTCP
jgi:hypothetical protein